MKQIEHRCVWANIHKIIPTSPKLKNTFTYLPHQEKKELKLMTEVLIMKTNTKV